MKGKKSAVLLAVCAVLFWGCKEKKASGMHDVSGNIIEIQPRESAEKSSGGHARISGSGNICVLFGYGFNSGDFISRAIETLSREFGLAENGGIVLPAVFPDDLHGRISNLKELIDRNTVRAVILLGAPENTHAVLARILEEWNEKPAFNIFSLFPQDDVLGQEGTCNFVLDAQVSPEAELGGDLQSGTDEDILSILVSSVEYAALLPGVLPQDSELHAHVQAIAGKRTVVRYVDSETGIQSSNHFVIEPAEQP